MAVTLEQCRELTGRLVELEVGRGIKTDRRAFTCRVIAVENRNGEDLVYVEPANRPEVGLALPVKRLRSMTLVPPLSASADAPLTPSSAL